MPPTHLKDYPMPSGTKEVQKTFIRNIWYRIFGSEVIYTHKQLPLVTKYRCYQWRSNIVVVKYEQWLDLD